MNTVCRCIKCKYCDGQNCLRPITIINEVGLCDFLYDKRGILRDLSAYDYTDKKQIETITIENEV